MSVTRALVTMLGAVAFAIAFAACDSGRSTSSPGPQDFAIVDDGTIELSASMSGTMGPLTIETLSGVTRTDIVVTVQ